MAQPTTSGQSLPTGARLRVLDAVRRGARTVNAIAAAMRVTDNAVRGHLASLERDGLVQECGVVRSGQPGKPALEYEVTTGAEVALSRAYAPVLEALVATLATRLDRRALRAALADAGRRLVPPTAVQPATVAQRTATAAAALESLGGCIEVSAHARHGDLQGTGCPLAAAVAREPDTCLLVREFLAAQTGHPVEMRCAHGPRPRCAFRIN